MLRLARTRPAGLEPATTGLEIPCSIRLSYGRKAFGVYRFVGFSKTGQIGQRQPAQRGGQAPFFPGPLLTPSRFPRSRASILRARAARTRRIQTPAAEQVRFFRRPRTIPSIPRQGPGMGLYLSRLAGLVLSRVVLFARLKGIVNDWQGLLWYCGRLGWRRFRGSAPYWAHHHPGPRSYDP